MFYDLIFKTEQAEEELNQREQAIVSKIEKANEEIKEFKEKLGFSDLEASLKGVLNKLSLLEIIKEVKRCSKEQSTLLLYRTSPGFFSFLDQTAVIETKEQSPSDPLFVKKMKAKTVMFSEDLDLEREVKQATCPKCYQSHPLVLKIFQKNLGGYDDEPQWDNRILILCPDYGVLTFAIIRRGEFLSEDYSDPYVRR